MCAAGWTFVIGLFLLVKYRHKHLFDVLFFAGWALLALIGSGLVLTLLSLATMSLIGALH
jgi:hypothetical protein